MKEILKLHQKKNLSWLESPIISRIPRIIHAFGSRQSVSKKIQHSKKPTANTGKGFNVSHHELFRELGAEGWPIASLRQTHSDTIFHISNYENSHFTIQSQINENQDCVNTCHEIKGDALTTKETGILLSISTADCIPALLVDPQYPTIAAVHAGWRGTLSRIVEKTAGQLIASHKTPPGKILAVLGPCIQACCYEIERDVFNQFDTKFSQNEDFLYRKQKTKSNSLSLCTQNKDKWQLNLPRIVRRQLQDIGLAAQNIFESSYCTRCEEDLFFSFRRNKKCQNRMITIIGIRPELR